MYKSSNITQRPRRLQRSQPQPLPSSGSREKAGGVGGASPSAFTEMLSVLGEVGESSPSLQDGSLNCRGRPLSFLCANPQPEGEAEAVT